MPPRFPPEHNNHPDATLFVFLEYKTNEAPNSVLNVKYLSPAQMPAVLHLNYYGALIYSPFSEFLNFKDFIFLKRVTSAFNIAISCFCPKNQPLLGIAPPSAGSSRDGGGLFFRPANPALDVPTDRAHNKPTLVA